MPVRKEQLTRAHNGLAIQAIHDFIMSNGTLSTPKLDLLLNLLTMDTISSISVK
jgi:hypothetical protein